MLVRHIRGFLTVILQVKELYVLLFDDHLPVSATHSRPEFGFVSKEDISAWKVLLLQQVGLETRPVKVWGIALRDAGDVGERWEQIEADDQFVRSSTCQDLAWPPGDGWHSVSTLVMAELAATKHPKLLRAHAHGPIVGEKNDECVFYEILFVERIEDLAHALIQVFEHPLVLGPVFGVKSVGVLSGDTFVRRVFHRLVRIVHCGVRDVQEERLVSVPFDELDAVVRDDVSGVAGHISSFQADSPCPVLVVVRRPIEKTDEFVEAVMDGVVLILISAMPLAKQGSRIALVFEHAWERWNRGSNPTLRFTAANDNVDDTDSLLVSTSEEGSAGGAAYRGIRVEVGKEHSFLGHLFDARSFHPAAVQGQVAAAEVVGQDHDDVWRPIGPGRT